MKETVKWTIFGALIMGVVGLVGATLEVLTVGGMVEVIDHLSEWEHYIPFLVCGLAGMIVGYFRGRTLEAHQVLEETLKEEQNLFSSSIEALDHPFYIIDINNYSIQLMNSATRKIYSDHNDLKTCFALTHGESRPCSERGEVCALEIVKRTKKPVVVEHTHFDKDGKTGIYDVHCYPIFNDKGKVHQVIEYSLDITKRKQAEKTLNQTKSQLEYLLKSTPAVIYTSEPHGNFQTIFMSENIKELLGYEAQEFLSRPDFWVNLMHPEDRERIFASYSEIPEKGYYNETYRVQHKNGTYLWVLEEAKLIEDEQGNPLDIVGYWSDVTDQKQAEIELLKSEKKYRTILENIEEGYYEVDLAGNLTFFNDSLAKSLGYSKAELMGMNNRQFIDEKNVKKTYKNFNEVYTTGKPIKAANWDIVRKDGAKRFHEYSISLISDSKGNPIGFRGITHDITESKKLEMFLKESEEKWRSLTENTNDIIMIVEKDGRIQYMNKTVPPYTVEEVIGKKVYDYIPKEQYHVMEKALKTVFETKQPTSYEVSSDIPDFGILWFETKIIPIKHYERVTSAIQITTNITERKQAEESLRQRTHDLGERVKELTCLFDVSKLLEDIHNPLDDVFLQILASFPPAWQYPEITCARIIFDGKTLTTDNFQETSWRQSADIILDKTAVGTVEVYYREEMPEIFEGPFLQEERDLIDVLAREIGDFIERRQTLMKLRESEERFKMIFNTASDGILIADLETKKFVLGNQTISYMLGYDLEEITSLGVHDIVLPEELDYALEQFEMQAKREITIAKNIPMKRKNGTSFYTDVNSSLMSFAEKSFMMGIFRDTTKQKLLEEALKESEKRYRTLFEESPIGLYRTTPEGEFLAVNPAFLEMLGCSPSDPFWHNINELISKIDYSREKFLEMIEKQDKIIGLEQRIRKLDGSLIYIRENARTIRNDVGSILYYEGSLEDITESKILEENLIEANTNLEKKVSQRTRELFEEKMRIEAIIKTVPVGILVIEPDGSLVLANKSFEDLYEKIFNEKIPPNLNIYEQSNHPIFKHITKRIGTEKSTPTTIELIKGYYFQIIFQLMHHDEYFFGTIIEVHDVTPFIEFEITQKQFVATVSHELRTPLTVLDLSIKNLQKYWEKLSEIQREEVFRLIVKSTFSLKQIIEDVLIISKIEVREIKLKIRHFNLEKVLNGIIGLFDSRLKEFKVIVLLEINPQLELCGDSKRIKKIFSILLDNAIKFSPDEESTVKIIAIDKYKGEYNPENIDGVLIQVIDFGKGIPEKELPFIFHQFYKPKIVKDISGIGIGLFIAKTFVEQHKGHIFVRSQLGKGTTFSVFLPRIKNQIELELIKDNNARSKIK